MIKKIVTEAPYAKFVEKTKDIMIRTPTHMMHTPNGDRQSICRVWLSSGRGKRTSEYNPILKKYHWATPGTWATKQGYQPVSYMSKVEDKAHYQECTVLLHTIYSEWYGARWTDGTSNSFSSP